jgi:hypothetical protein
VCPLRAGERSADVVTHFHEPLPHPAVYISKLPSKEAEEAKEMHRQVEEELEDLLKDTPDSQDEETEEQA